MIQTTTPTVSIAVRAKQQEEVVSQKQQQQQQQQMDTIVNLNNRAVSHLQKGSKKDDTKAIHYLYDALCKIRNHLNVLQQEQQRNGTPTTNTTTTPTSNCRPIKRRRMSISTEDQHSHSHSHSHQHQHQHQQQENRTCNDKIFSVYIAESQQQKQQNNKSQKNKSNSLNMNNNNDDSEDDDLSSCSENLFSFYKRAFVISNANSTTHKKRSAAADNNNDSILSVAQRKSHAIRVYIVLLYNIGLSFHKEGIFGSSSTTSTLTTKQKKHLCKALEFYDYGMSMIRKEWKTIDTKNMVLLLAISNNLGHVHSQLLNFQETKKSILWLRELMKANQQCILSSSSPTLAQEEYEFFFTNILIFEEKIQLLSCAPMA